MAHKKYIALLLLIIEICHLAMSMSESIDNFGKILRTFLMFLIIFLPKTNKIFFKITLN